MRIKFFATYREITGCKQTDVPAPSDVWAMFALLSERYGAPIRGMLYTGDGADIGENAIILINGRHVSHMNGKETALCEDDVVCVFPMVAGG